MKVSLQNGYAQKLTRQYLVVCRVGDSSIHAEWLVDRDDRNFDVFLDYFGNEPNRFSDECDFYTQSKGLKWPGLYSIIKDYNELIFQYDAVWFPDDDISVNTRTINEMFNVFAQYNLLLAQPALTRDSYFSHGITIENLKFTLRFTDFVEIMVPLFSREALLQLWPTFIESQSGWGLDSIWARNLNCLPQRVAIIDKTPVRHTRPVGGGTLYQKLDISPYQELNRLIQNYNLLLTNHRVLSAYSTSAEIIHSKDLAVDLISGSPIELLSDNQFVTEYLAPNVTRLACESDEIEGEIVELIKQIDQHNLNNLTEVMRYHHETLLHLVEQNATNLSYVLVEISKMLIDKRQYERAVLFLNHALQLADVDPEARYYRDYILHHQQKSQDIMNSKTLIKRLFDKAAIALRRIRRKG